MLISRFLAPLAYEHAKLINPLAYEPAESLRGQAENLYGALGAYVHIAFCSVTQTVLNDVWVHANVATTRRQMGQVTIEGSGVPAFVF